MNKHISIFFLSLTMVLGLTLGLSPTAYADDYTLEPLETVTEVKNFDEFKDAVENGGYVKLVADFDCSIGYLDFYEETTIDLNGHTMTVKTDMYYAFFIDAHLTIKDGSSDGNGTLIFENVSGPLSIYSESPLTLESGTLRFTSTSTIGIDVNKGPFTMTGGKIESAGYSICPGGPNVSISGGTIIGNFRGNYGEIDITGGKFSFDPTSYLKNGYTVQKDGDFWVVKPPVSYLDADGSKKTCTDYTVVTSSTTTWSDGWYVVKDNVTIDNQIQANGNVNLILCDGAKLNVNYDGASASSSVAIDIHNNESANFTIYAQSTGEDMGELNVKAPYSALRGKRSNITFNGGKVMMEGHIAIDIEYSTLTVNGGDITFTGDAGIDSYDCQMYVNGGNITVIGHYFGILDECQMYVNGGNVTVIGDYGAIDDYCIVKNSIPGTGWTNTEDMTAIKVSTEGQELSNFKKVQFPAAHTHDFTYTASGSTITATCDVENCTLTDNKVSLTIVAPEMTVSGTTKNANATLTGLEEFNSATELTVDAADIKYVNRDKGNETSTAPTSAGQYTAKITVEGQTASVDYEILAPVTLTVRSNNEDWGTVELMNGEPTTTVWENNDDIITSDGITFTASNKLFGFETFEKEKFISDGAPFERIELEVSDWRWGEFNNEDGWRVEGDVNHPAKMIWEGKSNEVVLPNCSTYVAMVRFIRGSSDIVETETAGKYTVNPGTEVTIKATPAEGFHLASWSNGAEVNEDGTQKIKVTEDINIVAYFSSPFAIAMDTDHKAEAANSEVQNGFEINTYGYCNDNSYRLKYYLLSGEPDQYKVEFDDNRFFDVDWTELATVGPEGTIDLDIPADIPTGDYSMKVTFRNSNYTTFDSEPIEVSFHVNLPETYTVPLYDNVIALVNTCECFTDVQWYHRDNSNADWQAISGATGYYYRQVGGLTGEYFVSAKMNGVSTYTCPQTDVKTLYGAPKKVAKVHVSPNPIENNATVSIEDTENLEHSLRIINVMGNVIEVRTFNGNSTSIDMGAYPTGSYMINVDGIGVKVIRK